MIIILASFAVGLAAGLYLGHRYNVKVNKEGN